MRLSGLSPEAQQRIAVLVPLVALGLSVFVVFPAWGRYRKLQTEIDTLTVQRDTLASAPLPKPGPVAPAAPALSTEPPQFLGVVRSLATRSECAVTAFDLSSPPGAASDAKVRAVQARIEVAAPYGRVREFLIRLASAPRLLVVSELDVVPEGSGETATGNVTARLLLERYVTTPEDTVKKDETPAEGAPEAGNASGL